jgi:hypothetical protein
MSQKLLLNHTEFENLLATSKTQDEFGTFSFKIHHHFQYGRKLMRPNSNIQDLKRFEKKLTKYIITKLLTNYTTNLILNDRIRIVEDKLQIIQNIEQGEFEYENNI